MDGPEHFRMAQELLRNVREDRGLSPEEIALTLRSAEVHAILAQTAAIAIKSQTTSESTSWRLAFIERKGNDGADN